jgi:hypothetical protein
LAAGAAWAAGANGHNARFLAGPGINRYRLPLSKARASPVMLIVWSPAAASLDRTALIGALSTRTSPPVSGGRDALPDTRYG